MTPTATPGNSIRRQLLAGAVIVTCLVLAGVLVWSRMPRRRAPTPVYQSGPVVNALSFSPGRESRYLAAAVSDGRLRVWESASRKELPIKLPSRLSLHDLAWTNDGTVLTGGFEHTILGWTVQTGKAKKIPSLGTQIVSLASRPEHDQIVISLSNGQLVLIDAASGEKTTLTSGHKGVIKTVRFHPSGSSFVTGGVDGQIVWHDWKSREPSRKIAAHQHEVSSLAFSENGLRLVSGSWDRTARIWDDRADKPLTTLNHDSEVAQADWLGPHVVTATWNETLHFWNPDSSSEIRQQPWSHGSPAFAVNRAKNEVVGIDGEGHWFVVTP